MPLQIAHPALLAAGFACVAIPILVHLLTRRRRRTVRWGAMRFLLEAYRKQKRRLQLEQLILLLMRCVLVGLIGLAVAGPMLGGSDTGGRARTLVIVIDDSIASGLVGAEGRSALERSKAAAMEMVNRLDAARGDAAALLTLGAAAQTLVLPPSSDLAGVSRAIAQIEGVQSSVDWAGVGNELDSWLSQSKTGGGAPEVVVFSRMLEGSAPIDRAVKPLSRPVRLRVAQVDETGADNVGIVDVQPPRSLLVVSGLGPADLASPVRVRLLRSGPQLPDGLITTVTAWLDGAGGAGVEARQVGRTSVSWSQGQTEADASIMVSPSALEGLTASGVLRVEIDRDALMDDNAARAPIELKQKLRVALVSPARFGTVGLGQFDSADWVRLALLPSEDEAAGIDLTSLQPGSLDRSRLAGLDAVIVLRPDLVQAGGWEALSRLVHEGGMLVVSPSAPAGSQAWTDAMAAAMGLTWGLSREGQALDPAPALAEPSGDDPASPLRVLGGELSFLARSVHVSRALLIEAPEPDVLLRTSRGEAFLVMARPEGARGAVALFASAIDPSWTDLPTKPMMVPLFQELVRQGVARGARGVSMVAGGVPPVRAPGGELSPVGEGRSLRLSGDGPPAVLRRSGVWTVRDAEGVSRGLLAVNADASGARTGTRTREQIERWLGPWSHGGLTLEGEAEQRGDDGEAGRRDGFEGLAWLAFAGALLLGLGEMFMARLASHAETGGGA